MKIKYVSPGRLALSYVALPIFLAMLFTFVDLSSFVSAAEPAEKPSLDTLEAEEGEFVPGEIMMKFKDEVPASEQERLLSEWGFAVKDGIPEIGITVLAVPENTESATVAFVSVNPFVEYAQLNHIVKTTAVDNPRSLNDPGYSSQWYLEKIHAPEAWQILDNHFTETYCRSLVNGICQEEGTRIAPHPAPTVAVVDSGIDPHIDLQQSVLTSWVPAQLTGGYVAPGYNAQTQQTCPEGVGGGCKDSHPLGHGTDMAGIIDATSGNDEGIQGLGYFDGVRIQNISFGYSDLQTTEAAMARAIAYAANSTVNYPSDPNNLFDHDDLEGKLLPPEFQPRVINISAGIPDLTPAMRDAVDLVWSKGRLIVAAAGNENSNFLGYPATFPTVLSVGAINQSDQRWAGSNWGNNLDVVAPGVKIPTFSATDTKNAQGLNTGYELLDGTSPATPIVAAVAALVWTANPSLTNAQVKSIIEQTADDLGTPGWDDQSGWGRINAARAVRTALSLPSNQTIPPLTANTFQIGDRVWVQNKAVNSSASSASSVVFTANNASYGTVAGDMTAEGLEWVQVYFDDGRKGWVGTLAGTTDFIHKTNQQPYFQAGMRVKGGGLLRTAPSLTAPLDPHIPPGGLPAGAWGYIVQGPVWAEGRTWWKTSGIENAQDGSGVVSCAGGCSLTGWVPQEFLAKQFAPHPVLPPLDPLNLSAGTKCDAAINAFRGCYYAADEAEFDDLFSQVTEDQIYYDPGPYDPPTHTCGQQLTERIDWGFAPIPCSPLDGYSPNIIKVDPEINFNWYQSGVPGYKPLDEGLATPIPTFKVYWQGKFDFVAAAYEFNMVTDGAVRIRVDNQVIYDSWYFGGLRNHSVTHAMSSGIHEIDVEYAHGPGNPLAMFNWKKVITPVAPVAISFPYADNGKVSGFVQMDVDTIYDQEAAGWFDGSGFVNLISTNYDIFVDGALYTGAKWQIRGAGVALHRESTPWRLAWDSTKYPNGPHTVYARFCCVEGRQTGGSLIRTKPVNIVIGNNTSPPPLVATAPLGLGGLVAGASDQTGETIAVRGAPSLTTAKLTVGRNRLGTVIGGPVRADKYTWWQVSWDQQYFEAGGGPTPDQFKTTGPSIVGWSVEEYLQPIPFGVANRVQTKAAAQIFSAPEGTSVLTTEVSGAGGLVVGGPAFYDGVVPYERAWWQVRFDNGWTGWTRGVSLGVNYNYMPPPLQFKVGDRVETTAQAQRLFCPGCAVAGTVTAGSTGVVSNGPSAANGLWWEVYFENGGSGWIDQNLLRLSTKPYPFAPGDYIEITAASANVFGDKELSQYLGEQPKGARGTILEGPVFTFGLLLWGIKYDDGVTGWSASNWSSWYSGTDQGLDFVKSTAPPPPPPDTTDPVISGVQVLKADERSAIVSWTTDEPSDSQVEYGPTQSYGSTSGITAESVTSHSVTLTNLQPGITYYYRVTSKDQAGNLTISQNLTFITVAAPVVTPPVHQGTVTASATTASSLNVSNVSAGSNSLYLASVAIYSNNYREVSSISGGGLTWTRVKRQCSAKIIQPWVELWSATGSPSGSFAATITLSGSPTRWSAAISRYTGADLTNPLEGTAGSNTKGLNPSCPNDRTGVDNAAAALTLTASQGNSVLYVATHSRNKTMATPAASFTQRAFVSNTSGGDGANLYIHERTVTSAGTTNVSHTLSVAADWDMIGVVIRPSGGTGSPPPPPTSDTTAPLISAVAFSNVTNSSATISWTTDEASNSQVEYGITTSYGNVTGILAAQVTNHSMPLGLLSANTTYHYRVKSRDATGNLAISGDFTFTTTAGSVSDTTAPNASITTPANNTTVSGTVNVAATASDNVGVSKVEFYVDNALLYTDGTAPYAFSWDTTNGGTHACLGDHAHSLFARAYDAAGNVGVSPSLQVSMSDPSYCAAPPPAAAPILAGISTASATTASSLNISNVSSGSNSLYLASVAIYSNNYREVSSISGGGLTWTRVKRQCSAKIVQPWVELWSATGSPSGSFTATITLSGSPTRWSAAISRYTGADLTNPLEGTAGSNTKGLNPSCPNDRTGVDNAAAALTLTASQGNSVLYVATHSRNKTMATPAASFTQRAFVSNTSGGDGANLYIHERTVTSAGTTNVSHTLSVAADWDMIGVVIRGAP